MIINYYKHKNGGVFYNGHAHAPEFVRILEPDIVSLRKSLEKEFPGELIELVLVE